MGFEQKRVQAYVQAINKYVVEPSDQTKYSVIGFRNVNYEDVKIFVAPGGRVTVGAEARVESTFQNVVMMVIGFAKEFSTVSAIMSAAGMAKDLMAPSVIKDGNYEYVNVYVWYTYTHPVSRHNPDTQRQECSNETFYHFERIMEAFDESEKNDFTHVVDWCDSIDNLPYEQQLRWEETLCDTCASYLSL